MDELRRHILFREALEEIENAAILNTGEYMEAEPDHAQARLDEARKVLIEMFADALAVQP